MENDQREQRETSDDKVMFLEYLGLSVSIKGTNMIVFGVTQLINFLSYYLYPQKEFIAWCLQNEEQLILDTLHSMAAPDYSCKRGTTNRIVANSLLKISQSLTNFGLLVAAGLEPATYGS